jgi:Pyruvate/2-oxoacid:ferredoxin oxidoreductase delta subunit
MDVCLSFRGDIPASGSGMREITLTDVLSLFDEATEKRLVARPYRNESQPAVTDGICFCCDDCCEYFTKSDSMACEKGAYIESTDMDSCNFCGDCIGSCYFHARKMEGGELTVERKICYGCGLCAEICPQKCIEMALR